MEATFWSGFRFLQASILHQLKGKSHVVNLRDQKLVRLCVKFVHFGSHSTVFTFCSKLSGVRKKLYKGTK